MSEEEQVQKKKEIFIQSMELSRKVQEDEITIEEGEKQFKLLLHYSLNEGIIVKNDFDAIMLFLARVKEINNG